MRDELDQARVDREIAALEALDDAAFAEALADNIADPLAEETAAFRSPALAHRSHVAVRLLVNQANNRIEDASLALRRNPRDEDVARRRGAQRAWLNKLGAEQGVLRQITDAYRVSRGEDPTAPNATSRAHRQLAKEYPVRFIELKRSFEAQIKAEAAAAKRARRAARVAARQAGPVGQRSTATSARQ